MIEEERFEFEFDDTINLPRESAKLKGIVFDVCPEGSPEMATKKQCIVVMSNEKPEIDAKGEIVKEPDGNELWAHEPFGYYEFNDPDCFDLAVTALKLFEKALMMENGLKSGEKLQNE